MTRWTAGLLGAATLLLIAGMADASSWRKCVNQSIPLSSTAETTLVVMEDYSVPWSAWIKIDAGTAVVDAYGYGACLDKAPAVCHGGANTGNACTAASVCPGGVCDCTRPGPYVLGTLNSSTLNIRGVGPVEAVSFKPTTCTSCTARVQFCGANPGRGL